MADRMAGQALGTGVDLRQNDRRPEQKRKLGHEHQADVVDMESSAIAEVCQKNSIPFGCIRVISDDVQQWLSPRLMNLIEPGRVSPWRLFKEIVRSPSIIGELSRLGKYTRYAADRLASCLLNLIEPDSRL